MVKIVHHIFSAPKATSSKLLFHSNLTTLDLLPKNDEEEEQE